MVCLYKLLDLKQLDNQTYSTAKTSGYKLSERNRHPSGALHHKKTHELNPEIYFNFAIASRVQVYPDEMDFHPDEKFIAVQPP